MKSVSARVWLRTVALTLFCLVPLLLSSQTASAATITVSGSIQTALNTAAPGDTVMVPAGTYTEQLLIDKSVTLQGAGAGVTILERPASITRAAIVDITGSAATVRGFTIRGDFTPLTAAVYVHGNAKATIDQSVIQGPGLTNGNGGTAVHVSGSPASEATISNNTIAGFGGKGVVVTGAGNKATISNNVITGAGPTLITNPGDNIEGVQFIRNGQIGIDVTYGAYANVTDNTISGFGYAANSGDPIRARCVGFVNINNPNDPNWYRVTGNTFRDCQAGVWIYGNRSIYATVSNNTFFERSAFGNQVQLLAHSMAVMLRGGNVLAESNTFDADYSYAAIGFYFHGSRYWSPPMTSQGTLRNNKFTGWMNPIRIDNANNTNNVVTITNNSIVSTGQGVLTCDGVTYDVRSNWWGNATGPRYAANPGGTGTTLVHATSCSGTNGSGSFLFNPWLTVFDATAPSAPTNLAAVAVSSSQINLSWNASTDNTGVSGYRVERCQGASCTNFTEVGAPVATTFSDAGLATATAYRYRVRARDAAQNFSSYSAIVSVTTQADTISPTTPSNLTAAVVGNQVTLNWTASTDNAAVSGYRVERCQGAGCANFSEIGIASTNSHVDSGLPITTTFQYRVRAADSSGNLSGYSNTVSATTQTNPQDGSIAQFSATSCQSILTRYPTKPNGAYWINPDGGTAFQTYCDMTTDGGGWTKWAHYPAGGSPFPWCSTTNTVGTLALTLQPVSSDTSAVACLPINRVKSIATAGTEVMARNNLFTTKIAFTNSSLRNTFLDATHTANDNGTILGTASVLSGGPANAAAISTDAGGFNVAALVWDRYMFMGYGPHGSNFGNNLGGVGGGPNINQAAAYYIRNAAVDTSAPSVPTNLSAVAASAAQVNVSWTASTDNVGVTGYKVFRNGSQIATVSSVTTYQDSSVSPQTTYSYTVSAVDAAGNTSAQSASASATTPAAPDTTAPSTPTGLTATALSATQTTLSWNASTDAVGVTGYRVFRNGALVAAVTGTSHQDNGLTAQTTYSYTVSAVDAAGNTSAQSAGAAVTTQPVSSTTFSIGDRVQTAASLNVRATPSTSGSLLGTQPSGVLGTAIAGPTYANGFWWWNINYDTGADGWSVEDYLQKFVPDTTAPSVPSGLTATAVSSEQIALAWNASTDLVGVTGYKVFRNGSLLGVVSNGTTYQDTAVQAQTTYSYAVAAYDAAGNVSPESAARTATTPSIADTIAPSVPAGLTAAAASATQANLSWSASTDNTSVAGYKVFRNGAQVAVTSGTTYQDAGLTDQTLYSYAVAAYDTAGNLSAQSNAATITTPSFPDSLPPTVPSGLTATANSATEVALSWSASTDNTEVVGYKILRNGSQIATVATTSYTDTSAVAQTTYAYTVSAYDGAGNTSSPSQMTSVTTPSIADTAAPSVPQNLVAEAASPTRINLSWSASIDAIGVAGYKIYRNGVLVATVTSGLTHQDNGLTAQTTYSYSVAAYDAANNMSARSAPASQATPAAPDTTAPSAPTGLTVSNTTLSSALLSWKDAVDSVGVTGYKVFRNGIQVGTATSTSYLDQTLSPATEYRFTVAAYDAAGNVSPQSAETAITTMQLADTSAPTAPTGLVVRGTTLSSITLAWNVSTDNTAVAGYRIFRGGVPVATTPLTSYQDTGLVAQTSYSYAVSAYDASNNVSAKSASVTGRAVTAVPAPSSPTGLIATPVSSSQVNLAWGASTATAPLTVAGYKVFRNGLQIAVTARTTFSDTGRLPSTTYTYKVAAYDSKGTVSAQSAPISATTLAKGVTITPTATDISTTPLPSVSSVTAPSSPTGLIATPVSSSQVNLAWGASTATAPLTVAGYKVFRNGLQIAVTARTTFSDTGRLPSTTYTYKVAAYDSKGTVSAQSAPISATTLAKGVTITPTTTTSVSTTSPTTTGSLATITRDLSLGSQGTDVSALQQILINKGYLDPGNVTGYFGALTEGAVKKFQTAVGLPSTGYVGALTREKLQG